MGWSTCKTTIRLLNLYVVRDAPSRNGLELSMLRPPPLLPTRPMHNSTLFPPPFPQATQETPVRADAVGGHQRRTCSSPQSVGTGQTAASALVAAAAADAAAVNTTASSPLPGDNQVAAAAAGNNKDAGVPPTAAAAASTQQRASTSAVGSTYSFLVPLEFL